MTTLIHAIHTALLSPIQLLQVHLKEWKLRTRQPTMTLHWWLAQLPSILNKP